LVGVEVIRIKERMSGRFGKVIVFLSGFEVGWLDVFLTQRGLTFHGIWKTSLQTSLLQGERL
jgi:hypothetical protein